MGFAANREIKLFRRVPGPGFEQKEKEQFSFSYNFQCVSRNEPSFATESVRLNRTELSIGGICSKSQYLTF